MSQKKEIDDTVKSSNLKVLPINYKKAAALPIIMSTSMFGEPIFKEFKALFPKCLRPMTNTGRQRIICIIGFCKRCSLAKNMCAKRGRVKNKLIANFFLDHN